MAEEDNKIKELVRDVYGKVAEETSAGRACGNPNSCCGAPAQPDVQYAADLGYSQEDCCSVPADANMGLGCGNPTAIANLRQGEVVLDLGSGGGFDCFLAARKVGPTGHVIGVDMTPSMIAKARVNAEKGEYPNVEFRLGEIEYLPVADHTVDVVISNCVINLSTNKPRVFQEIYRVLKPGGRMAISDIVANRPLPEKIRKDLAMYAGCVAGALSRDEVTKLLNETGFQEIKVDMKEASRSFIKKWIPEGYTENEADEYVAAASIEGVKQGVKTCCGGQKKCC